MISMSKANLLKLLEKKLQQAKAEDVRIAKKHIADENAALAKLQAELRAVLRLPYTAIKKKVQYSEELRFDFEAPACPILTATPIQRVIKMVKLDERRVDKVGNEAPYQIRDDDEIHKAIVWEPEASRPKTTVCD